MPNTPWSDDDVARLRQLVAERRDYGEIARLLGRTPAATSKKAQDLQLRKPNAKNPPWTDDEARAASVLDFPTFSRLYPNRSIDAYYVKRTRRDVQSLELTDYSRLVEEIEGDAVICACVHVPQTDPVMWNRVLAIGERDGIENLIIAGDIVTGDMFSHWATKESWDFDKELESLRLHLISALGVFQNIYITPGNHVSNRIVRISNGHIRLKHLIDMAGLMDAERERIFTTDVDFIRLTSGEEEFLVGHASNYSRIDGRVALAYAEKEECHVIVGNGHRMGHQVSKSGRWHGWDIGMIADDRFMGYVRNALTSYPKMLKSFCTVRNGAVKMYGEHKPITDWETELGEVNRRTTSRTKRVVSAVSRTKSRESAGLRETALPRNPRTKG